MSRIDLIQTFGAETAELFNKCSKAYEMGRADGYSQAENDYHKQMDIDMDKPMHFTAEQTAWIKKYISINAIRQRADAFRDCILEDGEYCWQKCCNTEHCKECKWLDNGDIIWFEL